MSRDLALMGQGSWLCARCTGLYVGGAVALLLGLASVRGRDRSRPLLLGLLVLAALANGVQAWASDVLTHADDAAVRLAAGALMGIAIGLVLGRQTPVPRLTGTVASAAVMTLAAGLAAASGTTLNLALGAAALATVLGTFSLTYRIWRPSP